MATSKKKQNTIVGLKELRENMETYIARVGSGESLTIVRRSEPIFKISPVDNKTSNTGRAEVSDDGEAGWETILDVTKVRQSGVPLAEVTAAIREILAEKK